jgi:hypothetical protein
MTSAKQAQANWRNACKSTGPKTSDGKVTIRHNALKHGLLVEEVLIFGEDEDGLMALGERLRDALEPEGDLEDLLVEQIVATNWRLRRLRRVEAGMYDVKFYTGRANHGSHHASTYTSSLGQSFIPDADSSNAFSKLSRYETATERSLFKTLHELQRLQATRRTEGIVSPPVAVDVEVSGLPGEEPRGK